MPWLSLVAYVFGGAFLVNAVPHFVSGVMGKAFQSAITEAPLSDFQIPLGGLSGEKEFLVRLRGDAPSWCRAVFVSAVQPCLLACRTAQHGRRITETGRRA
jgi:hypothetical protein